MVHILSVLLSSQRLLGCSVKSCLQWSTIFLVPSPSVFPILQKHIMTKPIAASVHSLVSASVLLKHYTKCLIWNLQFQRVSPWWWNKGLPATVAESLHLNLQVGSSEMAYLEYQECFENHPQWQTSFIKATPNSFPNSSTNWGPNIQACEHVGSFPFKPP